MSAPWSIPTRFQYEPSSTIRSWLWSLWLRSPQCLRSAFYSFFVQRFGDRTNGKAFRLPFGIYIKYGLTPDEPLAMDFVRKNTHIPVPEVLDVLPTTVDINSPGHGYTSTSVAQNSDGQPIWWIFVMTTVPGRPLFQQGLGSRLVTATDEQRMVVQDTIASWVDELHAIHPPPDFPAQRISGFLGGPFMSYRIDTPGVVGPFNNPAEFHAQDFCTVWPDRVEKAEEPIRRFIAERPQRHYQICLTHGDILLHNIMADEECRPTGLIDWETVGWMPEYWETASSSRSVYSRVYIWKDILREAFPRYDEDIAVERLIQLDYVF
ncbi:hypothetical protein EYR40_007348 [Pleurotus pulmonarius]|nr:hypothetical protein EYR36_003372 [Pleurotus pulmonarius]KAF4600236.1 hypothetical protein EYR40_007348 [Pleurotus pulmonarius]